MGVWVTTQWLEADAWLASVIQDLYALSDEELLQAGYVPPDPSNDQAHNDQAHNSEHEHNEHNEHGNERGSYVHHSSDTAAS